MGWWVAELLRIDPALLVSWAVWVIASIVLHELAHGWAAIRQGDTTPIETGHMTWNPVVHMGWASLIVFALVGIAWGAMPVNPSRFRGRYGDVIVSLAGPAMNLGLALVAVLCAALWGGYAQAVPDPLWRNVMLFFMTGAWLNVVLASLNLLPIPPLDGSRILAGLVPAYRSLISSPNAALVGMLLLVLLISRGGSAFFGPIQAATIDTIELVQDSLPGARLFTGTTKLDAVTAELEEIDRQIQEAIERETREALGGTENR